MVSSVWAQSKVQARLFQSIKVHPYLIIMNSIQRLIKSMEGYLELWQGVLSRWNRYYFRIHQELLLFGPTKEEVEGRVHLKVAQIVSRLDDPVSLMVHTGTSTLYLKAYSIDEKVRWFKKLKQTQKQVIDMAQNKQLFKMKVELSKINRFKILDDLNTELWKCHAELEQRFEEIITKTKNIIITKTIDKLRITIDEFKFKASQMLQYIDEQIRDLKNKQNKHSPRNGLQQRTPENDLIDVINYKEQDTQFYSFNNDLKDNHKEKSFKRQNVTPKIEEQSQNSFSSLSINLKLKKSINESRPNKNVSKTSSVLSNQGKNQFKYKLVKQNKVFLKYSDIFSHSQTRKQLPVKYTPQQKFPVFGTFSNALTSGVDLTKITMPVVTNQPLSALQKGCQQMYYSQLLNRADSVNDQNLRMLYVSAFAVSSYSVNDLRIKKPFNPLLGQTFEYIDEERGFEFLAEQVSHHPPISAFYVRSDNYEIYDNSKSTVSFSGNSIKLAPQSKTVVKLQKHNDFYIISKCVVSLSNIMVGKTLVQVYGQISIKCKQFQTEVVLQFQQDSIWKNTQSTRVVGCLLNQGKKIYNLQGYWNKSLDVENIQTKQKFTIWKKTHSALEDYYYFNELSLQLNNLTTSNIKSLPPTDSRLRPDQRALQFRDLELAAEEKNRLEEKQRQTRKQNEGSKKQHNILWFQTGIIKGEDVYTSNERYWDEKIRGFWKECLNIF